MTTKIKCNLIVSVDFSWFPCMPDSSTKDCLSSKVIVSPPQPKRLASFLGNEVVNICQLFQINITQLHGQPT